MCGELFAGQISQPTIRRNRGPYPDSFSALKTTSGKSYSLTGISKQALLHLPREAAPSTLGRQSRWPTRAAQLSPGSGASPAGQLHSPSLPFVYLLPSLALFPHFIHQEIKQSCSGFNNSELNAFNSFTTKYTFRSPPSTHCPKYPCSELPQPPLTPSLPNLLFTFLKCQALPKSFTNSSQFLASCPFQFTWMSPLKFKTRTTDR